jgi:hypothetical protein
VLVARLPMIHTGKPHDWVRIYIGESNAEVTLSSIDLISQCAICRLVKIEYGIGRVESHPTLDMGCTRYDMTEENHD